MRGRIERIIQRDVGNNGFGFIVGEDKNKYYFDDRSISNGLTTKDFYEEDMVEFEVIVQPTRDINRAANLQLFTTPATDTGDIKDPTPDASVNIPVAEADEEAPIKFYKKGFFKHIDMEKMCEHLKPGSGELEVLKRLSQVLYISHVGHRDIGYGIIYPFCLIGATDLLKQFVRDQYEFLLVFSHFDNESWQQNTVRAAQNIRHRKEIAERRPLVNFYILVSNAKTLKAEIDKMKGGTSAAIIPFTFEELLNCDSTPKIIEINFEQIRRVSV